MGRRLCLAGAGIGGLGLVAIAVGDGALTGILPGEPPMTPNAALALLLLGIAGALRAREDAGPVRRTLSVVVALAALAIGFVTMAEYALRIDLHVDRLLMPRAPGHGRPSPLTALALVCLAVASLVFDARIAARVRPSEWLIVAAGMMALTALLGFLLDAERLYRLDRAPLIGISLPTSVGLLVTALGMLLERPGAGVMLVATSPGPGGRQLRRFALPAVLLPMVLGLIVTFPLRAVDREALSAVVAVLAAAMTLVGLLVLAMSAVSLNRTYDDLESTRAHARALVEQAPDGVFVADLSGRYTDVNSAGCRMLGYSRDELLAKSITDLILPEEVDKLAAIRGELMKGHSGVSRWTLRRKDGSTLPVEVNAKIFADGRWQAQVRDISERIRLERELRAAEAEQKFLSELGSALVSTIDDRETVQIVAEQVVAQFADACSVETLTEDGRLHARVVIHRDPDKAPVCRRLERLALDSGRPQLGAAARDTRRPLLVAQVTPAYLDELAQGVEHRRALRELDPQSFMALPLLAHGGVFGSVIFISTSADRHFREEDLPFAEEVAVRAALAVEKARLYGIAQQAIRLRDDVLNIVAHDLRNPLGTVVMQAGLIRRRSGEVEERCRKAGEVIERAAMRMNHLIQDLLDVARMEGGRLSIEPARLAPQRAVLDAVQAQEGHAASASLQLRLDVAPELPELWADRGRLLQVFENLIGNAIKFTAPGGHVTVGAAARDGDVVFWVADTGRGIEAEDVPHVFDRLWQAKAVVGGAGLGLPIVKGIVEAHGGKIWVESAVGGGSTFYFTIPAAEGDQPWQPEPAPPLR
ncbi:MAG TPA: ATP-binding protein [Polyangia bacterium]